MVGGGLVVVGCVFGFEERVLRRRLVFGFGASRVQIFLENDGVWLSSGLRVDCILCWQESLVL